MRYVMNEKLEDCIKAFQKIAKEHGVSLSIKDNSLSIPKGKEEEFGKVFDKILKDFNKNNKCSVSWDQDNDSMEVEFSEKKDKKKEAVSITLDNNYKINEKILTKDTVIFLKEEKDSEKDIVLEKSVRINDVVLSKGEIISFEESQEDTTPDKENSLNERKIPREWGDYKPLMEDVYIALEEAGLDVRVEYSEYEDAETIILLSKYGKFEMSLYEIA